MTAFQSTRPSPGTVTSRVWEIADEITEEAGHRAKRAEVISRYRAEGGNPNTASTQYHYWKAQYDLRNAENDGKEMTPEPVEIQVKESGRVLLPAAFREALNIEEGEILSAEIVDGEIRLIPLEAAVRRAQALVRRYIPEGTRLVDELLADRRREAKRESAE